MLNVSGLAMLNAIGFVLLVYFTVAAARISRVLTEEADVLREYQQPQTLKFLVWLFPIGLLLLDFGHLLVPSGVAFVLCFACFVPGLAVASESNAALERAGTDRVQRAQGAATQVVGNGIAGLAFAGVLLVISLAAQLSAPTG